MKIRIYWLTLVAVASLVGLGAPGAFAVSPNPLENAYWRFEEGTAGNKVFPQGVDNVLDSSGNTNHMRAAADPTAPTYTNSVAPFALRSGAPNTLALDFSPHPGGGDDLFTNDQDIDNGIIAANGGFTIEAAFRPDVVGGPFQAIVGKAGLPNGPLPTLALKVRGDNGNLHLEQFDKAGNLVGVQSTSSLAVGQWYAAAAVNDGSNLSLYLRGQSDADYVLQGTVPVNGALYQGTADDWDKPWAIGRIVFDGVDDGGPADWFDGTIDEVRLTNRALSPSEFLFQPIPEPSSVVLMLGAMAALGWWRAAHGKRA